jgi:hypothetical protein
MADGKCYGRRKTGITSAITLNTTAAGVLPLPAATSNLTQTLITSATTLLKCINTLMNTTDVII